MLIQQKIKLYSIKLFEIYIYLNSNMSHNIIISKYKPHSKSTISVESKINVI